MLPNCNTKLQIGCDFMLWNVAACKKYDFEWSPLSGCGTGIYSVAVGEAFCLPQTRKKAAARHSGL